MARHLLTLVVLLALVALLALVPGLLGSRVVEQVATSLAISLVLVLGLQVFMGNSGILSFAHIGFMGVGAYASALFTIPVQMRGMALPDLYAALEPLQLAPLPAILLGGVLAALLAALVSYPLMRLSDAAAVITSFALLVVLHTVMVNWSAVTNGPRTLFGIPRATDLTLAAGAAAAGIVLAYLFKESRTGLLLRATRDDERAAGAIGAHLSSLRWRAFVLAAFFAGVGGGLWGHFITSFSPNAFWLRETFLVISMLVIGGAGTVTGAVGGTFLVAILFETLRNLETALNSSGALGIQVVGLTEIVLALLMILVMVLRPGGLFAASEIGALILRPRAPAPRKADR